MIEIGGAETHGGHGELARIMLRHGDDLGVRRKVQNLPQQLEALRSDGRLARRAEVE